VVPGDNLVGTPLKWGTGTGNFDGLWGGPPAGQDFPAQWGATGITRPDPIYGLLWSIAQRWLPAHMRFIGAWVVTGTNTEIDSIPSGLWNEALDVTFGGELMPFYRYSTGTG
jgi:hypothetical protein